MHLRIRTIMERRANGEKGFTLIELLVVIVIIGILAAIAIPTFLSQREKGWAAQAKADLKNAAVAAESYAVENNGSYADLDTTDLAAQGFRSTPGVVLTVGASPGTTYTLTANHAELDDDYVYTSSTGLITTVTPTP